jgi:hypothetical protein
MSTAVDAPAKKKSNKSVVGFAGLPQVNLLPPEVRAARGLVHVKRWLAVSVLVVVILTAFAYGFALLEGKSADNDLAEAQTETARLATEAAKYAEVPSVLSDLKRADDARVQGMSTEVLWKPYADAVTAVLPPAVSIDTFVVTQATPWLDAQPSLEPLLDPGVGTIVFSVRASTLPDSAAWLDALNSIPGFSGATFSAAAIAQDTGAPYYEVSSSVQVLDTAFSNRFAITEGK